MKMYPEFSADDFRVKVPSSVHLEYTQLLTKLLSYK